MRRSALADGAPEKSFGAGHGQQYAEAHGATRLAKDGDVARITPKGGDILLDPLEGSNLVKQGAVGVAISLAQTEKSLRADPVIDGHADHAVTGEVATVIVGCCSRSVLKGAARKPDHHRIPGLP